MNNPIRYIKEEQIKLRFQNIHLINIPVTIREPMHTFQRFIVLVLQKGFKANDIDEVIDGISKAFNIKRLFIADYVNHIRSRIEFDAEKCIYYLPDNINLVGDYTTPGIWYLETDTQNQSYTDILYCAKYNAFVSENVLDSLNLEREYIDEDICDEDIISAVKAATNEIAALIRASKTFKAKYGLVSPFECTVDTDIFTDIYEYSIPVLVTYEYNGDTAKAVDAELDPSAKSIGINNLRNIVFDNISTDTNIPAFIKYNKLISDAANEVESRNDEAQATDSTITDIDYRVSEALDDVTDNLKDQAIIKKLRELPTKFSFGNNVLATRISRICFGVSLALEEIDLRSDNVYLALSGIRDAYRQTTKAIFDSFNIATKSTAGDYFADNQCLNLLCGKVRGLEFKTLRNMGKLDGLLNAICHNNDLASEWLKQQNRESIRSFDGMTVQQKKELVLSIVVFLDAIQLSSEQLQKVNLAMDPLAMIGKVLHIKQDSPKSEGKIPVSKNVIANKADEPQKSIRKNNIMPSNTFSEEEKAILHLAEAKEGELVEFGHYYTDDQVSKQPIIWRVFKNNELEHKVTMLAEYCLDSKQYNDGPKPSEWITTEIRKWLNKTFLNEAFNEAEQKYLSSDASGDRIRLLKLNEAQSVFNSDEDRKAIPTNFAILKGASTKNHTKDGQKTCWWWLICEKPEKLSWGISRGGEVRNGSSFTQWNKGYEANTRGGGVRPVITIDTSLLRAKKNDEIAYNHVQQKPIIEYRSSTRYNYGRHDQYLYHLTDLSNMDSIIKYGLMSRTTLQKMVTGFIDVADQDIIVKRGKLEEYVPFHFVPKTPFDYVVKRNHDDKQFVYICVEKSFARREKSYILLSHPTSNYAQEPCSFDEGINLLDWDSIEDPYAYMNPVSKQNKMAECIIEEPVTADHFAVIIVPDEATAKKLCDLYTKNGVSCEQTRFIVDPAILS